MSKMLEVTFRVDPDDLTVEQQDKLLDFTDRTGLSAYAFETMDSGTLVALAAAGQEAETSVVDSND